MDNFIYKGRTVNIIQDVRKGKLVYWVVVNNHVVSYLSTPSGAKRFVINFIDTITDDSFFECKNKPGDGRRPQTDGAERSRKHRAKKRAETLC